MAVYEVWIEGYGATGEHDSAQLIRRVEAEDFRAACLKIMSEPPWNRKRHFDPENLTHWGRRLFDNETDARETFG